MSEDGEKAGSGRREEFVRAAGEKPPGLLREFWDFLRHNKKWWILPLLIALLAVAALVLLSGTALAPFLYPIF